MHVIILITLVKKNEQEKSKLLLYVLNLKFCKVPMLVQHFKIPSQNSLLEKQYQNHVREQ